MNLPLCKPDIGEHEIEYVTRVLHTGQLSLGPWLKDFEERFAAYVGTRYAVATSSGTAALHLCVRALGIGPEDEVITTSFSFVASTNCLLYERALPMFVDIDPITLNIDPREIRTFLEERCIRDPGTSLMIDKQTGRSVKAVLPVHVFGVPCDMDAILELAREYGLFVIEDACEAIGAKYKGRSAGTFGDAAAFAFYPNKQITTGEGGMIVTNNNNIAVLCRSMRNQGREDDPSWLQHVRLGYNYRLSDLHCALGVAQLERIDELLKSRENVAALYNRALNGNEAIRLPYTPPHCTRSWFVYVVQLAEPTSKEIRDRILKELRTRGIGCQAYFPAIHLQPYLQGRDFASRHLPITESAADRTLALPFFSAVRDVEISFVCDTLLEMLERAGGEVEALRVKQASV